MKTGFKQKWGDFRGKHTAKPKPGEPEASPLPPFSKTTWPLYLSVAMQTIKSLVYYALGALLVGGALGVGILGGYFASIIDDTAVPSKAAMTRTLKNVDQSTALKFAHNVDLSHVKSDLLRDTADLDHISPWLQKALVATEDEEFYEHDGIVPKSLVRAVFSDLTGVGSQTGGSTLTQQVVKMQFLSAETTFKRKAVEIMYALRLNHYFSKQEILAAYLNIATLGRNNKGQNIAGVQTAAQGLFGKNAADLNLAQAAFIAGLPQSPSIYTPYTNTGELKTNLKPGLDRQKTVLFRMYRAGTITKAQYNTAKTYDLKADFLPTESASAQTQKYSYVYNMVTSEATSILAKQMAAKDGHSADELSKNSALNTQYQNDAGKLLATKGYTVHSTINKSVYDAMQDVVTASKSGLGYIYTKSSTDPVTGKTTTIEEPVQSGAVLMDNDTGAIVSFVGGTAGEVNHIYTKRSPGSSIKPILVYGPAVENKVIGTQTMLADFANDFGNYSVTDYGGVIQNKFVSASYALAHSYNIPTVNLYSRLRQSVDVKSYMVKNGIDTLTQNDYNQLGLALGGTDYGMTVQQAAGAFATFQRGGTHITPYVIDKIVDPLGNVVYQHKAKKTRVFSDATSYIMQQMLHQVITAGTATALSYQLSFDTDHLIGKTGTSNDYKDVWFLGSTPGLTMASWMGYDNANGSNHLLTSAGSSLNQGLWAKLMNAAYRLMPKQFALNQTMRKPSAVRSVTVNALTGQPNGSVLYNGSTYNVNGGTVESLYNGWAPTGGNGKFAIGGDASDYELFWEYFGGGNNDYGIQSTKNEKPKTAAQKQAAAAQAAAAAKAKADAAAAKAQADADAKAAEDAAADAAATATEPETPADAASSSSSATTSSSTSSRQP
ncbi:transglycosylase domain-containing protein [Lacticaseibacillus absianus]|uniref:transglycosylase domain-containing protein n=1 Tax=Lacticaseibacillus absianus TaxID=2729623 RepID=UPI001FE74D95|nr:transglycosylase domain-containing protein [Lacticaseibacillus absianus]